MLTQQRFEIAADTHFQKKVPSLLFLAVRTKICAWEARNTRNHLPALNLVCIPMSASASTASFRAVPPSAVLCMMFTHKESWHLLHGRLEEEGIAMAFGVDMGVNKV